MNKLLRPFPYPMGSESRRMAIVRIMHNSNRIYRDAMILVIAANQRARSTPLPGEM